MDSYQVQKLLNEQAEVMTLFYTLRSHVLNERMDGSWARRGLPLGPGNHRLTVFPGAQCF